MDIDKLIKRIKCPQIQSCPMDGEYPSCKACQKSIQQEVITALSASQAENEKRRSELEQMTACIYYKPGGLCRYGGDDPANVCVFGPCPHEVSAHEFLSELKNVKAERDAAVSDMETIMAYGGGNLDTCQYCKNGQCYVRGGTKLCLPKWRGPQKED